MFAGFGADQARSDLSVFEVTDEERETRFEVKWQEGGLGFTSTFGDLGRSQPANQIAAEFVRDKIRATVNDPQVAELLCPCLLYTSPSPRDVEESRMPSSA